MANPFDTLITADIFNQPRIGSGSNGTVYPHPTDNSLVVKVPNKGGVFPDKIEPTPIANPHAGRGFGTPIAQTQVGQTQIGNKIFPKYLEVQPRIEGSPVPYYHGSKTTNLERISHLNNLRKLPQEAFNNQRADVKYLADNGYNFDPKPGNTLIDKTNGKLNLIDIPIDKSEHPIPWDRQREWLNSNLQVPDNTPVKPGMTPRQQNAAKIMYEQIKNKLGLAAKVIPGLGLVGGISQINDIANQLQYIKNKGGGWITPATPTKPEGYL